jgi:hypothetical protein
VPAAADRAVAKPVKAMSAVAHPLAVMPVLHRPGAGTLAADQQVAGITSVTEVSPLHGVGA